MDNNKQIADETFEHRLKTSAGNASAELDISQTSIWRFMKSVGLKH